MTLYLQWLVIAFVARIGWWLGEIVITQTEHLTNRIINRKEDKYQFINRSVRVG